VKTCLHACCKMKQEYKWLTSQFSKKMDEETGPVSITESLTIIPDGVIMFKNSDKARTKNIILFLYLMLEM
jgi:hypothetical protein